jgi:hypothetical protein
MNKALWPININVVNNARLRQQQPTLIDQKSIIKMTKKSKIKKIKLIINDEQKKNV